MASLVLGTLAKALACVVLGMLALLLWRIDKEIPAVSASMLTTSAQIGGAASRVGAMSNAIVQDAARLTTRADRVLIVAGATESELHKAAMKQRNLWDDEAPLLVAKLNRSFDHFDAMVDDAGGTLRSGKQLLDQGTPLLKAATKLTTDTDAALTDPRLDLMLTNGAKISASMKAMTEDSEKALHKFLTPKPRSWKTDVVLGAQIAKWFLEIGYYGTGIRW